MNEQLFTTIPFHELEKNFKSWLREVLTETTSKDENSKNIPEILTRKQTATLLKCTLATLHNWHKQGKLTPKKIGSRVLYNKQHVLSALQDIDKLKYKNAQPNFKF